MANRQGNNSNSDRLFLGAPKSLQMVTAAMKLKDGFWQKPETLRSFLVMIDGVSLLDSCHIPFLSLTLCSSLANFSFPSFRKPFLTKRASPRYSPGASQVALVVKNLPTNAGDIKNSGADPWVRRISWRRARQPTLVFLPGEFHGQRSLEGYSTWSCKEPDMTE